MVTDSAEQRHNGLLHRGVTESFVAFGARYTIEKSFREQLYVLSKGGSAPSCCGIPRDRMLQFLQTIRMGILKLDVLYGVYLKRFSRQTIMNKREARNDRIDNE